MASGAEWTKMNWMAIGGFAECDLYPLKVRAQLNRESSTTVLLEIVE